MAPNKTATSRNRFKKALTSKTAYSFKNDGLDILVYLAYIKFLNNLQKRVEALKQDDGTNENLLTFYKQAASEILPKYKG